MVTVQIEHPIRDYAEWKATFDRDPARREASGVRRYRVNRPIDDPRYVLVDLDFDSREAADAFVATMRSLWPKVEGTLIGGPKVRIVDCVEQHEY
jgi:quinol monooxygenase YgiN